MNTVIRLLLGALASLAFVTLSAHPAQSGDHLRPTPYSAGNFYGTALLDTTQVISPEAPELICYDLSDETAWTCWEPEYDPYRNAEFGDYSPEPVWVGSTEELHDLYPHQIPQK